MSYSYTYQETVTFTATHARHMAAKVATDLKRIQRFYNAPSDKSIAEYQIEIIELLKAGYLGTITFGFKKDGNWIEPTVRYTARDLSGNTGDDHDPGKIRPGANINGASFYSFLTYSPEWENLTPEEKNTFKNSLPFFRGSADEPSVNGYLENDRTYSSGGRALDRASVRSYS